METLEHSTTTRHEYRMKGWQQTILVVIGAAGILGALAILAATFGDSGRSAPLLLVVFIAAFGIFMLSSALRSRLIIDRDHIEVRGAIREWSAESSEITGFRRISSRNGSFIKFYLKDGRGTRTMSDSFAIDDTWRAWLRKIPDLDKNDRDALLNEISQQQELGATPEERLATLSQAKTSSIFALVVACAAAVALNFGPPILQVPFAIVLALVPVALALMLHRAPLLYSVFKRKSDPRAELCYALIAVSFGFLLRNRGVHLVSLRPLGLLIVFVAFAYFAGVLSLLQRKLVSHWAHCLACSFSLVSTDMQWPSPQIQWTITPPQPPTLLRLPANTSAAAAPLRTTSNFLPGDQCRPETASASPAPSMMNSPAAVKSACAFTTAASTHRGMRPSPAQRRRQTQSNKTYLPGPYMRIARYSRSA